MPIETKDFIEADLQLPNHANELSKAESEIEGLKYKLEIITRKGGMNDELHDKLYERTCRILDYVGQLSIPAFNIEDLLEEMYTIKFKHSPALAKKLWLDHYEHIHHPYNLLKNRCYRMLGELDKEYFRINKKTPPNWKI